MEKVVFLDRDGVINRDSEHYVKTWAEFSFLPRSLDALRRLHAAGFTAMLITNQSAINRKITTASAVAHIHAMMCQAVADGGGRITDVFFCPHRPEENCACRKPKPGLIFKARDRHRIDLSDATMIGDSAKDIQCALNAGCGRAILVRTGNGTRDENVLARADILPDYVAGDLFDAVDWLTAAYADDRRLKIR